MSQVNYDLIAPSYDQRYETNRFDGILAALTNFVGSADSEILEVGCGTGHWLSALRTNARITGLDPSGAMLQVARERVLRALPTQARAESLPFDARTFDRVFCVNALHHFESPSAFLVEALRVLTPGGGVLIIGLDPHMGVDAWWIYDYFPSALAADLARYTSAEGLRSQLRDAGFSEPATALAQHIPAVLEFDSAVEQGFLDRRSTSQFQVIGDAERNAGVRRLFAERPVLRADLRLWATTAWC